MQATQIQSGIESPTGHIASVPGTPPTLLSVARFSIKHPEFTESAMRAHIFAANSLETSGGLIAGNGLIEAGAILRLGRKVLINEIRFFKWIEDQQQNSERDAARRREALRSIKRRSSPAQDRNRRSGKISPSQQMVKGAAGSSLSKSKRGPR